MGEFNGAERQEACGASLLQRLLVAGAALSLLFSVAGASPAQAFITGMTPGDNTPTNKDDLLKKVDSYKVNYQEVTKNDQPKSPAPERAFRDVRDGGGGAATVSLSGMPLYDPTNRR